MNEPLTVEQAASQLHQQRGGSAWAQVAEASERVRQAAETADDTCGRRSPKTYPGGQQDGQHAGAREAADDLLRDRDERGEGKPAALGRAHRPGQTEAKRARCRTGRPGRGRSQIRPLGRTTARAPSGPLKVRGRWLSSVAPRKPDYSRSSPRKTSKSRTRRRRRGRPKQWQAQIAQEEQHRAAQEAHQRQTQASQQTQQLSEHRTRAPIPVPTIRGGGTP